MSGAPLRIMVVSCVFPPEPVVSARTCADLAAELVRRGHAVTVVTGWPSRPAGRLYPGFRRRLAARQTAPEGYRLVRCFSAPSRRSGIASRFLENAVFGLASAAALLLAAPRPHAVYANTWPVVAAALLAAAARCRGVPLITSVQDLYPESLAAQGRLSPDSRLARALRRLDGWVARRSRAVLPVARRFAEVYRTDRGVPAARVRYMPNWLDARAWSADPAAGRAARAARGIPQDALLLVYAGNVGVAAGVETVIAAFRDLADDPRWFLLIAGEGSRLEACRRLAADGGNPRVRFWSPWPAAETAAALGAADVFVLPTRGQQARASMPSKLIAYLLAERPVLALAPADSDLAELTAQGGGWVVPPDAPSALAEALRRLAAGDRADLRRRGAQGRRLALDQFSRAAVLPGVADLVERVARKEDV